MIGAVSSGVFSGVSLGSESEVVILVCLDTPLHQDVTRWTCVIGQRFLDEDDILLVITSTEGVLSLCLLIYFSRY